MTFRLFLMFCYMGANICYFLIQCGEDTSPYSCFRCNRIRKEPGRNVQGYLFLKIKAQRLSKPSLPFEGIWVSDKPLSLLGRVVHFWSFLPLTQVESFRSVNELTLLKSTVV